MDDRTYKVSAEDLKKIRTATDAEDNTSPISKDVLAKKLDLTDASDQTGHVSADDLSRLREAMGSATDGASARDNDQTVEFKDHELEGLPGADGELEVAAAPRPPALALVPAAVLGGLGYVVTSSAIVAGLAAAAGLAGFFLFLRSKS